MRIRPDAVLPTSTRGISVSWPGGFVKRHHRRHQKRAHELHEWTRIICPRESRENDLFCLDVTLNNSRNSRAACPSRCNSRSVCPWFHWIPSPPAVAGRPQPGRRRRAADASRLRRSRRDSPPYLADRSIGRPPADLSDALQYWTLKIQYSTLRRFTARCRNAMRNTPPGDRCAARPVVQLARVADRPGGDGTRRPTSLPMCRADDRSF